MNIAAPASSTELRAFRDSRFTVPAMRCAGCIAKIERGLGAIEGVVSARVNFSNKRVAIRHDEALGEEALKQALAGLGFEAVMLSQNPFGEDDKESKLLLRCLGVSAFGMMNIMLLSISVWSGAGGVTRDMFHWLSALIGLPVIAYAGRPFFASAAMALRYGRTNMDVPISIGVILAGGMSLYETLNHGPHAYFDSAVMLLFFLLSGRALDSAMRGRTRAGLGVLLNQMGKSASVVSENGRVERLAADALRPGMVMLVVAGEALAADGEVAEGEGLINNSMLTGESAPVSAKPGDNVFAGAINLGAPLYVRITASQDDSVLADISRLMDEAGQSRGRYVRIADRAARLYAPLVHSLALIAFIGWMIAGADWHKAILIAISVLIITCPCAMGLAVPAAQVVLTGALAKLGVLVKDGGAIERLAEVDRVFFDKTGTLTLGQPEANIDALDESARSIALALAQSSRHPLSRALTTRLHDAGVEPAALTDVTEQAGEGISGLWQGQEVSLRRADALAAASLSSSLIIGENSHLITYTDPWRYDVPKTLTKLADIGLQCAIISGDHPAMVADAAQLFGIEGTGGVSPADKLAALEALKAEGQRPLMVGDGLNDGPALSAAHASLAPSGASDASQQAADAVFLGKSLRPVATAILGARASMRIVRQNFGFSIAYNLLAVPLAVAGLVTPLIAALAMSLSSLIVIVNSLRLARIKGA